MSSFVMRTSGAAPRPIKGSVTRPAFAFGADGRPSSCATARLTRSFRLSPCPA